MPIEIERPTRYANALKQAGTRIVRLRKNGEWATNLNGEGIAGAEARVDFAASSARLKSCPVTKRMLQRVFPQPVLKVGVQPIQAALAVALLNFLSCYFRLFMFPHLPMVVWGDQVGFFDGGIRMAAGQVPIRDYFEVVPPATDCVYAVLVRLFGARIWIPNLLMALLAAAAGLLITLIASRVLRGLNILLPGLLLAGFIVPAATDATHHWFSTIAVLAAVLVILDKITLPRIAAAGALCGIAACFTQSKGGFCLAAFAIYLLMINRGIGALFTARRWLPVLVLCGFAAGAFLLFNAWFIRAAGFGRWFYALLVFPARYYFEPAINNWRVLLYDFKYHPGIIKWLSFPFVYATVPFACLLALWVLHRRNEDDDATRRKVLLIAITGIALFLAVAAAPSVKRMGALSPPALLMLTWLLSHRGRMIAVLRFFVAATALTVALGTPARLQTRTFPRLILPAGPAAFHDRDLYSEYQWFLMHTHPGEYMFGLPPLYSAFWLQNPSALEGFHASDYSRPQQIAELVESLDRQQVPLLVLRDSAAFLWVPKSSNDHLGPLRVYVRQHYALTTRFPSGDEVWERVQDSRFK